MEKRLILAIALSLLVVTSWSALVSKQQPIVRQKVAESKLFDKQSLPIEPIEQPLVKTPKASVVKELSFVHGDITLNFIESEAAIKDAVFTKYHDYKFNLESGFLLDNAGLEFYKDNHSDKMISFVHKDETKKIAKQFIFDNSLYCIELRIMYQNLSSQTLLFNWPIVLGMLDFSSANANARFQDITVAAQDKTQRINGRKDVSFQDINFIALRDRYFCLIVEPEQPARLASVRKSNHTAEIRLDTQEIMLNPGESRTQTFHIYLGPQRLGIINKINPQWASVVHYGTFDFISQIILQFLELIYKLVHNWGLAIIILSFSIYFLLYPLSIKQMRSMKEMQALQPHIEELRKRHKDNPQKMNKEIMELYKEHKVNPFGGCLPLLLQMPIFFALYQALMRSVILRGAEFLWIKDLSEPDRLFRLPMTLPVIGNEFNILPIIMAIGMFFQQKISMKTAATSNPEQQKLMMIIFPLMFGFIFYRMPSGLVLYWFINSTLMLVNQLRIRTTQ